MHVHGTLWTVYRKQIALILIPAHRFRLCLFIHMCMLISDGLFYVKYKKSESILESKGSTEEQQGENNWLPCKHNQIESLLHFHEPNLLPQLKTTPQFRILLIRVQLSQGKWMQQKLTNQFWYHHRIQQNCTITHHPKNVTHLKIIS